MRSAVELDNFMTVALIMKIAPEGIPFITVTAGITLLFALLTIFMLYFFRDPERNTPQRPDAFISPADGRIIIVKETTETRYLNTPCKQISIFMSPFNVHVNRSPCDGKVVSTRHNTGRYFAAYKEEASIRNENSEMVLATPHGSILVRQIAGFIARRTVCRAQPGQSLSQGERFGIIKFSSRVDLYIPANASVTIKPGDRVFAGETIVATMPQKS